MASAKVEYVVIPTIGPNVSSSKIASPGRTPSTTTGW